VGAAAAHSFVLTGLGWAERLQERTLLASLDAHPSWESRTPSKQGVEFFLLGASHKQNRVPFRVIGWFHPSPAKSAQLARSRPAAAAHHRRLSLVQKVPGGRIGPANVPTGAWFRSRFELTHLVEKRQDRLPI
jgi:hypothetical protein